jgi:chorismate synthase
MGRLRAAIRKLSWAEDGIAAVEYAVFFSIFVAFGSAAVRSVGFGIATTSASIAGSLAVTVGNGKADSSRSGSVGGAPITTTVKPIKTNRHRVKK